MQSPPPPTTAPLRAPLPCPRPPSGLVAIVVDPRETIEVRAATSFLVALRLETDDGVAWQIRSASGHPVLRYSRTFTIADGAYPDASGSPASPAPGPVITGAATQFFLYDVIAAGGDTLVFDLLKRGDPSPVRSETFVVHARPSALAC